MNILRCLGVLILLTTQINAQESDPDLRLTLPPTGFAVVGAPIGVDFDNIVLTQTPERYRFTVECPIGETNETRWSVTPQESDVGKHTWRVTVWQDADKIAETSMTWRVNPAGAGVRNAVSVLIVGDSLTHATIYPNDLARRMSAAGQPAWTMLGTHKPASAANGVAHEGYGGWTWERFVRHYEPNPDPAARKHSSPFVFLQEEQQQPRLDVDRYFAEACAGKTPDYVILLLGINDCFGANPNDSAALDAHIDRVFTWAEILLAAFRRAAPQAELGVCLTTPPNSRQAAFTANYQDRYPRWGWKRIQHRLVERQLQQFGDREGDSIFVIPTELNLNPVTGYPENNAVHPNAEGYQQIAASLHAWLTARWHSAGKTEN